MLKISIKGKSLSNSLYGNSNLIDQAETLFHQASFQEHAIQNRQLCMLLSHSTARRIKRNPVCFHVYAKLSEPLL